MLAITVNGLSMSFGAKKLFENISFALEENDKLVIIGVNGCGKSTLFKIILGDASADSGSVFIAKDKSVGILTQDCAFEVSDEAGESALCQMYLAFPEHLAAEKRLSALEEKMQNERDPDGAARLSAEY